MAMTAVAVGAIAAPIIGGIMGNSASAGDRMAAQMAMQEAYNKYANINIPDTEKMKLALQDPTVQGILQPYMEQNQQLGPSSMQGIQTDPRLQQAQMNALDTLSKMGAQGLTAEDRASLNAARRQVSGDAEAQQKAIVQQMAQRGVGGSGVELASRLAGAQAQADRASQQTDQTMSMAQQRMLQAVAQAGQLGGQIRSQDFSEQSTKAQAADAIARFNAEQAASTQARNIASQNAAAAQNLAEKQRVADATAATRNTEQQYNKGLLQQDFNNRMALTSAQSNALLGQGNMYQNQANQTANFYSGIGSGLGQGLMGVYAANANSPKAPAQQPAKPAAPANPYSFLSNYNSNELPS